MRKFKIINIGIVILFIIYSLFIIKSFYITYKNNDYYNNYFYYNENKFIELYEYLNQNKLSGRFNFRNETYYENFYNTGSLYEICIEKQQCSINGIDFKDKLKSLEIEDISVHQKNILLLGEGGKDTDIIGISLTPLKPIYSNTDNYIYYSTGFFKGKKAFESFDGNEMHVIYKIFNDDWGILNGCYGCGGGGWD